MTPAQRKLRAKIAAHSKHAQGKTDTSAARAAFLAKFETEDDLRVHMMKLRLSRMNKAA
jgi:hypothetical protein